jgi:hypothetical protein
LVIEKRAGDSFVEPKFAAFLNDELDL